MQFRSSSPPKPARPRRHESGSRTPTTTPHLGQSGLVTNSAAGVNTDDARHGVEAPYREQRTLDRTFTNAHTPISRMQTTTTGPQPPKKLSSILVRVRFQVFLFDVVLVVLADCVGPRLVSRTPSRPVGGDPVVLPSPIILPQPQDAAITNAPRIERVYAIWYATRCSRVRCVSPRLRKLYSRGGDGRRSVVAVVFVFFGLCVRERVWRAMVGLCGWLVGRTLLGWFGSRA